MWHLPSRRGCTPSWKCLVTSTESIEVYCPSYLCQSAAIFTATVSFMGDIFQRPCKNLRLSYHYMLITCRRRLSYRSSQLTNDHDFLWKAPVAQNVSQRMSCRNRWQKIVKTKLIVTILTHIDHISEADNNFQYRSTLSSKWPYCQALRSRVNLTVFFLCFSICLKCNFNRKYVSSTRKTCKNYINSIQIDPNYILSSMTIFVLFVKYNKNTPNSGKSIEIHFKKNRFKIQVVW